jgi:glycosyltransferase involved in cell wall biosynthesis
MHKELTIRPQKVLLVITKSNWGGAQKYVYDLATNLQARGHLVSVATSGTGELVSRLRASGVSVHTLSTLKNDMNIFASVATFFELVSLFRKERPEVVHLNSSKVGLFGAVAARITFIQHVIFTAHGWPFNEERPWWQKIFLRNLMQVTVLLSSKTICVSKSTLTTLHAPHFISKKCIVIHNGIASISFLPPGAFFSERNLPQPTRTTLFSIGELHASKGYDLALGYLKNLQDLSWEWHIVGEGSERKALEHTIATYNLSDRVFLHGYLYGSPYIPSFDIFFLPSRTEGLAYVALEALQSSLPIIASNAGGIPEALGNDPGTTLINIRSESTKDVLRNALSAPVVKIDDSKRDELRKEFSLSHMIEKTIEVYQS